MTIEDKLHALGLVLPDPPEPIAAYLPALRVGNLLLVSGQLPLRDGRLIATGPVESIDAGQAAARQCVLNGLAIVKRELGGDWSKMERVVRLVVYVQSRDGFADQAQVANGASELLVELFGESGRHVRAAVGVNALPMNAMVEAELFVAVRAGA